MTTWICENGDLHSQDWKREVRRVFKENYKRFARQYIYVAYVDNQRIGAFDSEEEAMNAADEWIEDGDSRVAGTFSFDKGFTWK